MSTIDEPRRSAADGSGQDWQDWELVPISALEHYSYCPRQCGLIHVEQVFDDNVFTVRGHLNHQRVDESDRETRPNIRREFALPLWSRRLGLTGRADVVEFTANGPYPVEHKSGKQRAWGHEALQLCAQGVCLEEMIGVPVECGAVYYRGSRLRREIVFDDDLRRLVEETTVAVRVMIENRQMPLAINDARCRHCSLQDACLPSIVRRPARERAWRTTLYRLETPGE